MRRFSAWPGLAVLLAWQVALTPVLADVAVMRNGMQFHGRVAEMASLNENPLAAVAKKGEVAVKQIILIDDGLRRTFVRQSEVASFGESPAGVDEKIRVQQRVAANRPRIADVRSILRITPWNEYGRRTFSMLGSRGPVHVVQGITEVTPVYSRVEGLQLSQGASYTWDMRVATTSIPRDVLTKVLRRQIDPKKADDRLRIYQLYLQAERYRDALVELSEIMVDFPELDYLAKPADRLRQLLAQELLREIQFRQDAGQHERVVGLLNNFPETGIAGETLLKVRDLLGDYDKRKEQYDRTLELLAANIEALTDEPLKEKLIPIYDEIQADLGIHTLSRTAAFLRLADDEDLKPDQKVALGISGWLLGGSAAIDNLAVASSLVEVRDAVVEYLNATRTHEREEILERIRGLEGGTTEYISQIVANMKPPIQEEIDQLETPGLYAVTVPGIEQQADFTYLIQLPPEYSPYKRYPCVVTLNGAGTSPEQQIDWWAGSYNDAIGMRQGQAARRGYIVIAPLWQKPFQKKYEYTFREHAAVLFSLRDAIQRTSIDCDHVFLSGHSMGGDAAWDIGISHPDLWAGVIPVVAKSDRYVHKYSENARGLPMYFIGGEKDGGWLNENGMEFDRYLNWSGYNCTIVQYQGRGHESFSDEIHRVFEWMGQSAHRRDFAPRKIEVLSMRPWDNYFWWLEMDNLPERSVSVPAENAERNVRPMRTEAQIVENNRISIQARSGRMTVWLSPDMVDFEKQVVISINSRKLRQEIKTDIAVLLEDVRTRGDRQNPFWAKVEWPERR